MRTLHPMSKTLLFALLALCALPPASRQVSPERIAELERQLEEQRARNELQGVRLKQLEQTLASVIAAQAAIHCLRSYDS